MIAITYTQAQQNQIATLAEEQPRPQRTGEEWDAEVLAWKRQLWQIRDLPERVLGLAPRTRSLEEAFIALTGVQS